MTLTTGVEGIGHMLLDRLLSIPDYQRAYSWEIDEVTDLWNDLSEAMKTQTDEYFLGSVVTTTTDGDRRGATSASH